MDFENYEMVISSHIMGISVHYAATAAGFQYYDMVTSLSTSKIDGFSELPKIADHLPKIADLAEQTNSYRCCVRHIVSAVNFSLVFIG